MTAEEKVRGRELAAIESAFRTANDRMRLLADSHRFAPDQRVPFLCECGDPGCREIVMLSIEDYERLRKEPCWFLLLAGHEEAEAKHERIVEAENGYAIVEKVGASGLEAARLDPRAG